MTDEVIEVSKAVIFFNGTQLTKESSPQRESFPKKIFINPKVDPRSIQISDGKSNLAFEVERTAEVVAVKKGPIDFTGTLVTKSEKMVTIKMLVEEVKRDEESEGQDAQNDRKTREKLQQVEIPAYDYLITVVPAKLAFSFRVPKGSGYLASYVNPLLYWRPYHLIKMSKDKIDTFTTYAQVVNMTGKGIRITNAVFHPKETLLSQPIPPSSVPNYRSEYQLQPLKLADLTIGEEGHFYLIETNDIKVTRFYTISSDSRDVTANVKFTLKEYCPAGNVTFVDRDGQCLANSWIDNSQKEQKVELDFGATSHIQAESHIIHRTDPDTGAEQIEVNVDVTSYLESDCSVTYRYLLDPKSAEKGFEKIEMFDADKFIQLGDNNYQYQNGYVRLKLDCLANSINSARLLFTRRS